MFGDHAVCCASSGLYACHNRLRDGLRLEAEAADLPVLTEVTISGSDARAADLADQSAPIAVDVSVVHPLHPSCRTAEDTARRSADDRERRNVQLHASSCAAAEWSFLPCAAEILEPGARAGSGWSTCWSSGSVYALVAEVAAEVWKLSSPWGGNDARASICPDGRP